MPPKQAATEQPPAKQYNAEASDARMEKLTKEAEKRAADKEKKEAQIKAVAVDANDVNVIVEALALTTEQATRRLQENGGKLEKVLNSYMKTGVVSQIPLAA